ncbi:MAG: GAF and ANTAR domain-containing protein [Actinobacteria bacterium]|nr:GAF and ANTAR domain-containing protein [Actinomycetota bacterium]
MQREELLSDTFVVLADTLVDDFDPVEFLLLLSERCVALFDAEAAGVMLAAPRDTLTLVASSSERMRLIELFELQGDEGPCPDCYRTGVAVLETDLPTTRRWPNFTTEALRAGFLAVNALPMRLRGETIGALNIFRNAVGPIPPSDLRAAQALADVATLSILQNRRQIDSQLLTGQLQHALSSRIVLEQAKGILAERANVDVDEAFTLLRRYARHHNRHLSEVAQGIVAGTVASTDIEKVSLSAGQA